jgi:hypothetical protein
MDRYHLTITRSHRRHSGTLVLPGTIPMAWWLTRCRIGGSFIGGFISN